MAANNFISEVCYSVMCIIS